MHLCISHLKKKLSELNFWFSSYDHFSDIICKTRSSGQNVIPFFGTFLKLCVDLVQVTLNLKLIFCIATRGSNLLLNSKFALQLYIVRLLN